MIRLPWAALAVAALLLAQTGCQRVKQEKTYDLGSGEVQFFGVDPPRSEQKVEVTITSDAPIDAYLILEESFEKASEAILTGGEPEGALAGKKKATEISLSGTAPARKAYGVAFGNAKTNTSVRVKIEGK